MDAREALEQAEAVEFALDGADGARAECFAIPSRRGAGDRGSRWVFLVATDLPEAEVREALPGLEVQRLDASGSLSRFVAWPTDA